MRSARSSAVSAPRMGPAAAIATPRMSSKVRPSPSSGIALMLLGAMTFAVMSTTAGAAYQRDPSLSAWTVTFVRSSVSLVTLIAIARGSGASLWGDRRPALWWRGVAGALSLLGYFLSMQHLSIGEAGFLNQTSAIWVAMLAPLVLGERTGRLVWLAVLGSLVGVALLVAPRGSEADLLGRGVGLASGLTAAFAYLCIRRASATNGPVTIVFYFSMLATVVSAAGALLTHQSLPRDPVVIALLIGAGLSATAAQLLLNMAYARAPAGPVAAASATSPMFNTLLGALFLNQAPDRLAAWGMVILLVTGVLLPGLATRRTPAQT